MTSHILQILPLSLFFCANLAKQSIPCPFSREGTMKPLTLEQTWAYALEHHPALQALDLEISSLEAHARQAGLLPNPEIHLEIEEFGRQGRLSDLDSAETGLQIHQRFQLGGKRAKRQRLASLDARLAGWDLESARLDILADAHKAFIRALASQERESLRREIVHLHETALEIVSRRVAAGKDTSLQNDMARVALSAASIALERTSREKMANYIHLASSMGLGSVFFSKVVGHFDTVDPIPEITSFLDTLEQNPNLARWDTEAEHRRAAADLAKASGQPDLTLAGGLSYLHDGQEIAFKIGVGLPLPVFDRNQWESLGTHHRLASVEARRMSAQLEARASLEIMHQKLWDGYTTTYSIQHEVLPIAQRALEIANQGYREGKFGYWMVLEAQRTLFQAKEDHLTSLETYHLAHAEIARLLGRNIDTHTHNSP